MAAEYGIPFSAAVWETPIAIGAIMLPVRNERHGGSSGPGFTVTASLNARNKARAFLETQFTIVDRPVEETGWQLGENTFLKI